MPEFSEDGWERDDSVHRTIVLPRDLAERLAAEAGCRGVSLSDLLAEYAEQGLRQAPITPRPWHHGHDLNAGGSTPSLTTSFAV